MRQVGSLTQHGRGERQISVGGRGRHDDRDIGEAQTGSPRISLEPPDLGGDRLELAARARAGQERDALVGEREGRRARARGRAIEDVGLQLREQRRVRVGPDWLREAWGEVAVGQIVEQLDVLATRPRPEHERGRLVPVGDRVGRIATGQERQLLAGTTTREARPLGSAVPSHATVVEILPILATRIERVEEHVARARERREDIPIEPGDVRDAEDVGRPRRVQHASRATRKERGEVEVTLALGATARLERAAVAVQREPGGPLPDLFVTLVVVGGAGHVDERLSQAPGVQQVGAREGIFVEERRELGGELGPAQVDDIGGLTARRKVRAHGREVLGRKPARVVEECEQLALEHGAIDERDVRRAGRDDRRQVAAQIPRLEVRRDAVLARDAELHVGLDLRVRHDERHGLEEVVARVACRPQVSRERAQQLFGAVRVAEVDHRIIL